MAKTQVKKKRTRSRYIPKDAEHGIEEGPWNKNDPSNQEIQWEGARCYSYQRHDKAYDWAWEQLCNGADVQETIIILRGLYSQIPTHFA